MKKQPEFCPLIRIHVLNFINLIAYNKDCLIEYLKK